MPETAKHLKQSVIFPCKLAMAPFLLPQFLECCIRARSGASLVFHNISFQVSVVQIFPRQGVTKLINMHNVFVAFMIITLIFFQAWVGAGGILQ